MRPAKVEPVMNHDPDNASPKNRPDFTLLAMIVSTGLLIAWANSSRQSKWFDLSPGAPLVPMMTSGQ